MYFFNAKVGVLNAQRCKTMDEHYAKITKYMITLISEQKGAKRGELLGQMNQSLKSIIDDDDLMMFILESLPYNLGCIVDF